MLLFQKKDIKPLTPQTVQLLQFISEFTAALQQLSLPTFLSSHSADYGRATRFQEYFLRHTHMLPLPNPSPLQQQAHRSWAPEAAPGWGRGAVEWAANPPPRPYPCPREPARTAAETRPNPTPNPSGFLFSKSWRVGSSPAF